MGFLAGMILPITNSTRPAEREFTPLLLIVNRLKTPYFKESLAYHYKPKTLPFAKNNIFLCP